MNSAAIALGLLALVSGCDRAIQAAAAKTSLVARPELRISPDGVPLEHAVLCATIDPTRDVVRVAALRSEPIVIGQEPLLRLYGRDKKTLEIPIPPSMPAFNRTVLRLAISRADAIDARLLHAGNEIASARAEVLADPAAQTVTIDFPRGSYGDGDVLTLTVLGEGSAAFGRIELSNVPIGVLLPAPDAEAQLIEIGDDARRGRGLSSMRPMEATFDVPLEGELGFSYGIPEIVCFPGRTPTLVVTLIGSKGLERVHRLPIDQRAGAPARWFQARLPVDDYQGTTLRVRFELETDVREERLCALAEPKVYSRLDDPPTVLLITSDTHRGDHLGAAHEIDVSTPTLDALAARGVFFERCYSSTNVTLPSHTAILTGTPVRDTRIVDNMSHLSEDAPTIAERFREAGFMTFAAVSASHLDARYSGLGQGFDRMATTQHSKREAGETIGRLERWIDASEGRPLFVWLHLFDAHMPYAPPRPFDVSYYAADKDPRDPSIPLAIDERLIPPALKGVRDLDYPAALYKGEVTYLDGELARLLSRSRFKKGIVAFTADHGESLGRHGVYWDHGELYPDSIHVPLIVAWPGAPRGTRVTGQVDQLDIGRTLLDLAGLAGTPFPGRSMTRFIGADASKFETVHTISAYGFSASATSGKWHAILTLAVHMRDSHDLGLRAEKHQLELYDLESDPTCEHDLARTNGAVAREMRAELLRWLAAGHALNWDLAAPRDAGTLANLAGLGYVGQREPVPTAGWFPESCVCPQCTLYH